MNHKMGAYNMLQLSKSEYKRKKAIAIATAQMLFHIDPDVDPDQEIKEFISILDGKIDSIITPYGRTSGDEIAKLISKEGLDTGELKRRILLYKNKRHSTNNKNNIHIKSALSDYLSDYSYKSKTYDGLVDQIQFFPKIAQKDLGSGLTIDNENATDIMKTFTEKEKENLLKNVNSKIAKKDAEFKLGQELEKYLNDIGLKYGIDCSVDDFEYVSKNFFGIKVYIGDRGILSFFNGTFEELKAALVKELELEAGDKVTCRFCGRKIVRYVAINKLKNCDCGAKIVITDYTVTRRNIIYQEKKVSFMK